MARKKSPKQKIASVEEFSSSPFKNLQGLPALMEQKPQLQERAAKQTVTVPSEHHSFADEMDFLGVRPLPGRAVQEPVTDQKSEKKPSLSSTISRDEREAATFLDAVGSVEKIFKDEWPDDEPVRLAVPRRIKQLERGQRKLEAELDLHGLTVDEASAKVRFFLQNVSHQGFQAVLIITGKGVHSNDGPVLRKAVEALLEQQREQVLEWGIAPRRFGGDGALVVFLRPLVAE